MPGFFNQKNFLSTLLAVVSRQEKISIEKLDVSYRIMKAEEKVPMRSNNKKDLNVFYIYGLWLYGAKWDETKGSICDLTSTDQIGNMIPTLELTIEEHDPTPNIQINGSSVEGSDAPYVNKAKRKQTVAVHDPKKWRDDSTSSMMTDSSVEDMTNSESSDRMMSSV